MIAFYRTPILDEVQSAKAGFDWYMPGPLRASFLGIRIPVKFAQGVNGWL